MNPDAFISQRLFADGILRPVFLDDAGGQCVLDLDEFTGLSGVWLRPVNDEAVSPLVVSASDASRRRRGIGVNA
jgi:hypothetical protein